MAGSTPWDGATISRATCGTRLASILVEAFASPDFTCTDNNCGCEFSYRTVLFCLKDVLKGKITTSADDGWACGHPCVGWYRAMNRRSSCDSVQTGDSCCSSRLAICGS